MLSVGVDMIEISRIERAMSRHGDRFFKRFFTARERESCDDQASRLAGRFVVKEAVGKALGTGIGDVNWTDIEIVNNGRGKPELVLHNQARTLAAELGLHHWSISLSHTETHAIGFAVALGKGDL
jgi:holo-[acyl-carrier protein] synthase